MLNEYLLAGLAGLGCGVAHGLYLLLVLYTALALKRVWKNLLLAFWYVHVGGPLLLITLLVVPHVAPRHGTPLYWLVCAWVIPFVGSLLWFHHQHPDEPQIVW